ncbi:B-cell antigen receptor complex-associated protein beta chain [Spea bombifrons]|uniref:B-cell antigen receptor complex-associated protein beta chain n=1 Tax=Spea bombifrons TaxID=233779 RepID=UPI00234A5390|nr:B-cell antigen receptor complex-associated protein beta chain [Spea bombifrons]
MRASGVVLCVLCGLSILSDHGVATKDCKIQSEKLFQEPRFIAQKKGRTVTISCRSSHADCMTSNCSITWYRGTPNGSFVSSVNDPNIRIIENQRNSFMELRKIHKEHSGIYFCKINTTKGEQKSCCGTELMVLVSGKVESAKSRNIMKDAIIMFQTFFILLFTVIPVMLLMEMKKKRSVKLEDHTYEGLDIYQSATYEDIQNVRVLSTKSMIGEHPFVE